MKTDGKHVGVVAPVKSIVDTYKGKDGVRYFRVAWKDTWEPELNLLNCNQAIDEFWTSYKKKKLSPNKGNKSAIDCSNKVASNNQSLAALGDLSQCHQSTQCDLITPQMMTTGIVDIDAKELAETRSQATSMGRNMNSQTQSTSTFKLCKTKTEGTNTVNPKFKTQSIGTFLKTKNQATSPMKASIVASVKKITQSTSMGRNMNSQTQSTSTFKLCKTKTEGTNTVNPKFKSQGIDTFLKTKNQATSPMKATSDDYELNKILPVSTVLYSENHSQFSCERAVQSERFVRHIETQYAPLTHDVEMQVSISQCSRGIQVNTDKMSYDDFNNYKCKSTIKYMQKSTCTSGNTQSCDDISEPAKCSLTVPTLSECFNTTARPTGRDNDVMDALTTKKENSALTNCVYSKTYIKPLNNTYSNDPKETQVFESEDCRSELTNLKPMYFITNDVHTNLKKFDFGKRMKRNHTTVQSSSSSSSEGLAKRLKNDNTSIIACGEEHSSKDNDITLTPPESRIKNETTGAAAVHEENEINDRFVSKYW